MTDEKLDSECELVKKVAKLSNLPVSSVEEEKSLAAAFAATLEVMDQLQEVDVQDIEPTTRIGNDVNRWREDEVDLGRMFTQQQALANAQGETYQGFFMTERLIDHEA